MLRELRSGRSDDCVSNLQLDNWLSGLLADEQTRSVSAHLTECQRCRDREAALRAQRERFVAEHPGLPTWFSEAARARGTLRGGGVWLLSSAALAAAALLALVTLPHPSVRTKGDDYLTFYVKRGAHVHRGAEREPVRSGDQLRFAYTAASARYLAIVSLDGAQRTSVYYPPPGEVAPMKAGREVPLPSGIELDDAPGEEHIFALFCDRPPQVSALRAELAAKRTIRVPPPGCALDQVTLIKEVATP